MDDSCFEIDLATYRRHERRRKAATAPKKRLLLGSFYIPKPDPARPSGQDAHFVSGAEQAFGVADSVGGWSKKGVDSSIHARQLMLAAAARSSPKVDPMAVLRAAHASTTARGSSTACVVALDGDRLRVANVGDSGLWVFRSSRRVFETPVQQSRFNCPYQLGLSKGSNEPGSADRMAVLVEVGDVIVCGTDGLLDNVYPSEIEELLRSTEENQLGLEAETMAQIIAEMAFDNSRNRSFVSPFAINAWKAGRHRSTGGKADDITVIVAFISTDDED